MKQYPLLFWSLLISMLSFNVLQGQTYAPAQMPAEGYATYYADRYVGRLTASEEVYRSDLMTAAHKTHPFGTLLRVTRLDNNRSVVVRVNDRGPFCQGCVVDLSKVAAKELNTIIMGKARVRVEVVGFSNDNPPVRSSNLNELGQTSSYGTPGYGATNYGNDQPTSYDTRNRRIYSRSDSQGSYRNSPASYDSRVSRKGVDQPTNYETRASEPLDNRNSLVQIYPEGEPGFGVQLGAFKGYPNAESLYLNLLEKGFEYLYVKVERDNKGDRIYKVIVGPFSQKEQAFAYSKSVTNKYKIKNVVIQMF